jgi:hypothetical protein
MEATARDLLDALKDIIRCAFRTLVALPDPDGRYLSWAQMPVHVVHDLRAYGYNSPTLGRFQPTAADISQLDAVEPLLSWLRRTEGEQAFKRLMLWSLGVPLWKIGGREGCSDQTIINRIDRSVSAIVRHFANVNLKIEEISELKATSGYFIVLEKPSGPHGEVRLMRVYVGSEKASYIGHRRWRDGRERAPANTTS